MAFDSLSNRLQASLKKIKGQGALTEKHIDEMMRDVRLSLLEADVNYKVVKEFLSKVKEQALGEKVLKGLNPGQQVVKIVQEELKIMLGGETTDLKFNASGKTVFMTAGLQGVGKTTAIGKMAVYFRKTKKLKPLMIAADIYRPAAVDQLVTLGKQVNIDVFQMGTKEKVTKIVKEGLKFAKENGHNFIIVDTAGRLHIDEDLIQELKDVKKICEPDEVLLTVDAMTGQDAVNVAKTFNENLEITGVILTKLDGDTRGGAALSIKSVTNVPIKLMSTGEHLDELEVFHPDRMADRILGMGDVLTLIENATQNIDEDEAMGMMEKMTSGSFNYNDMLKQFKMVSKMGSFSKIMGLMPGMSAMKEQINNIDDKQFVYMEAIISSMTKAERSNPDLIENSSKRRERVAKGSGRNIQEVNKLRQSLQAQRAMGKQLQGMDEKKAKQMQRQIQSGNMPAMGGVKAKKGKGKGRGGFRF
ncbi:MAG: signal recognition particle protein [bacterium]